MYQTREGITLLWELTEYPRMHSLNGDVQEKELLLQMAEEFTKNPLCISVQVIWCIQTASKKFSRSYLFNWKRRNG